MPTKYPVKFEIAPGRSVSYDSPCFIITEIGQNHNGNLDIARELIKIAKESGADCVKFQKSNIESRFTKDVINRPYNSANAFSATYGHHRQLLELDDENFILLSRYAKTVGIHFAASGMDKPSVDFLNKIGVPFFKIGSADTTNLPLILHASRYKKPVIISTGMTCLSDVSNVYNEILKVNENIAILQCTSAYPAQPSQVHLNVIKTYKKQFPRAIIGYSGHEVGISISLAAVASGAKVLERHITLDHSLVGSDHKASLNPSELKHLVTEVRKVEAAVGSYKKEILDCEKPCFEKLGKTIVASRSLHCGTVITEDMLDVKVAIRKGLDPIFFYSVIGQRLTRDLEEEETLFADDLHLLQI